MNGGVPSLSICIPTYRMGRFLPVLLDSILEQMDEDVEVCVSNNGSDDDTTQVVQAYAGRFRRFAYFEWPKNMGIDLNIEKAIAIANGTWCWLMGSDDILAPGGFAAIRRRIAAVPEGCDIILGNRRRIDEDTTERSVVDEQWFPTHRDGDLVVLTGAAGADYFRRSPSLGCVFSYLSTIAVRKAPWDRITDAHRFEGNQYMHAARLLSMTQAGSRVSICTSTLVVCRYRVIPEDRRLQRLLVDFQGYHDIGEAVIADVHNRRRLWSILGREHPFRSFIRLRELSDDDQWRSIRRLLRSMGFSRMRLAVIVFGARWVRARTGYFLVKHRLKTWLIRRGVLRGGDGA
jgi:abequosyltransferase